MRLAQIAMVSFLYENSDPTVCKHILYEKLVFENYEVPSLDAYSLNPPHV